MKKISYLFLFVVGLMLLQVEPTIACVQGRLLNKFGDLEIYLGELNQYKNNENAAVYFAQNQRLKYELCVKNLGKIQSVKIEVCSDSSCSKVDNSIRVKGLVSWYKDGNAIKSVFHSDGMPLLLPELLLESGDFIRNDDASKISSIKTKVNRTTKYIKSKEFETIEKKDKNSRVPHNAIIYNISDTGTSKSHLVEKEMMFYVIGDNPPNSDISTLKITQDNREDLINLSLIKLPFDLINELNSGVYYRALYSSSIPTLSSERKTDIQLRAEFRDMLLKGINYPTVYIYDDYKKYMAIRGEFSFPKDKIFLVDNMLLAYKDKNDWVKYRQRINLIKRDPVFKGFKMIYFYLADEPSKDEYENIVKNVKSSMKNAGVSFFVAGKEQNLLNTIVDGAVYVIAYEPKKEVVDRVRQNNAQIYSYAIPQVGVNTPEKMRFNYGFKMILSGYNGMMPYAYQDSFGSQWSDFDSIYRDHMLTYPVSDGLIDTIHGLAYEDAITDYKFMNTLNKVKEEFKIICNKNPMGYDKPINMDNLDETRNAIANEIIEYKKATAECQRL